MGIRARHRTPVSIGRLEAGTFGSVKPAWLREGTTDAGDLEHLNPMT